jgi:hypothetical protein
MARSIAARGSIPPSLNPKQAYSYFTANVKSF